MQEQPKKLHPSGVEALLFLSERDHITDFTLCLEQLPAWIAPFQEP
jgi:hypothetical protein